MKTVTGTLLNSSGVPVVGSKVSAHLIPTTGWAIAAPYPQIIDQVSVVTTDSGGVYTFTLKELDTITPAGLLYRLEFYGVAPSILIGVYTTTNNGAFISDVLVPEFIPVGNTGKFVTYVEGDQRYAFKGAPSAGSSAPPPLISTDANNALTTGFDSGLYVPTNYRKYSTQTSRDANWPADLGNVGDICYTAADNSFWVIAVAGGQQHWMPPWNQAWGRIGYANISAITGITSALANIATLDVSTVWPTWLADNSLPGTMNRIWRVQVRIPQTLKHTAGKTSFSLQTSGGVSVSGNYDILFADTETSAVDVCVDLNATSFTTSRIIKAMAISYTGTLDLVAGGYITVDDCGPVVVVPIT